MKNTSSSAPAAVEILHFWALYGAISTHLTAATAAVLTPHDLTEIGWRCAPSPKLSWYSPASSLVLQCPSCAERPRPSYSLPYFWSSEHANPTMLPCAWLSPFQAFQWPAGAPLLLYQCIPLHLTTAAAPTLVVLPFLCPLLQMPCRWLKGLPWAILQLHACAPPTN